MNGTSGWGVALLFAAIAGCHGTPPPAAIPPPKVTVAKPVSRSVTEWDEYTGRLEAIDSVEVRARVSGYLEAVKFRDGAMVKKGDILFIIDSRPYTAILRRTEAELALAKARLELAQSRFERASRLVARNAISQEEADTRAAEARQAEASVQAAQAALEAARLDVEYTEVRAPVSGRVGRKLVTEGNLVNGASGSQGTLLTTIVSLDPIYVYFEADERSYLKYVRLAQEGKRPSSRNTRNPVQIAFADEKGFPHEGYTDFVDNHLDEQTGTIVARAVLANPDNLLSPGLFARVRLIGSGEYAALLIPDEAIGTDQARKFVYVVDADNHARYRPITLGPMIDGLRVVRDGLTVDERIVVNGMQRAKPDALVDPQEATPTAVADGGAGLPSPGVTPAPPTPNEDRVASTPPAEQAPRPTGKP
ncbi:MAG TPA: efflux RND transporter periplasmic adaptor subunit [Candidatus Dormibacteraeota bacterium]|nr:efflux RND transporter periplasmic adaptor subunit [Candidatus Dormibacteraeota bacterium]